MQPNISHPPTPCPWLRLGGEVDEGVVTHDHGLGQPMTAHGVSGSECAWRVVLVG